MAQIILYTEIEAPITVCFDMARNIDLHQLSTAHTQERAVAGKTSGLCELNDEITWEAVHLGIRQKLTGRITRMNAPVFFEDEMVKGAFKSLRHQHFFESRGAVTVMKDIFTYELPLGPLGRLFDKLYLEKYMTNFLVQRNQFLKNWAEHKIA